MKIGASLWCQNPKLLECLEWLLSKHWLCLSFFLLQLILKGKKLMLLLKLVVKWCYEYQGSCSRERLCGKGVADSFSSRKADGYVVWWWAFFIHSRVEWFDVDTSLYIITSWLFINTKHPTNRFKNLKSSLIPEGLTSQKCVIKQIIS